MLNDVQYTYAQSLINTYRKEGYNYYLLHDVTRNVPDGQLYSMYLYISKTPFTALSTTRFTNAGDVVRVAIDTSSFSYNNADSMLAFTPFSNFDLSIENYYSIFTNAEYATGTIYRLPDILEREGVQVNATNQVFFVCLVVLLTIVFIRIFR